MTRSSRSRSTRTTDATTSGAGRRLRALGATTVALGAGTALALAPAVAASAHVSATATSTVAGSYSVLTFAVPHGCEGSPTLVVEIEVPEGILSVTPTVKSDWAVEKRMTDLAEPVDGGHGTITERVSSVVYTALGDGLADGYRDTFDVQVQLPQGEAGDVVAFPVTQHCVEGTAAWAGEDAPSVTLTAAAPETGSAGAVASGDALARGIGVGGLVVGAVGIVLALTARRDAKA